MPYLFLTVRFCSDTQLSFCLAEIIFLLPMDSSAGYLALCLMTTIPVFFMNWLFVFGSFHVRWFSKMVIFHLTLTKIHEIL